MVLVKYVKTFRFNSFSIVKSLIVQNILKNALSPEWVFMFNNFSYYNTGLSFKDSISNLYFLLVLQKKSYWTLTLQLNLNSKNLMHVFLLDDFWSFSLYRLSIFFLKIKFFEFFKFNTWQFFEVEIKSFLENFTLFPLLIHILLIGIPSTLFGLENIFWYINSSRFSFSLLRYINTLVFISPSYLFATRVYIFLSFWLESHSNLFSLNLFLINNFLETFVFLGYEIKYKFSLLFISPCFEVLFNLKKRLKNIWFRGLTAVPQILILKLNPIIRNWLYYFRPFLSNNVLARLDFFVWFRSWRYAKRRHPSKSSFWIYRKYFTKNNIFNKIRFCGFLNERKIFLLKFQDFRLSRQLLVGDLKYSYKFLRSSTLWSCISFNSLENYFVKIQFLQNCFFLCILCTRLILNTEFVSMHIFDNYFKQFSQDNKYYAFLYHRHCFLIFFQLNIFFPYIQSRFLLVDLSRTSF